MENVFKGGQSDLSKGISGSFHGETGAGRFREVQLGRAMALLVLILSASTDRTTSCGGKWISATHTSWKMGNGCIFLVITSSDRSDYISRVRGTVC